MSMILQIYCLEYSSWNQFFEDRKMNRRKKKMNRRFIFLNRRFIFMKG